jgi:hypothetical protein
MNWMLVPDQLRQCYATDLQKFIQFAPEDEENMQIYVYMCFYHTLHLPEFIEHVPH